MLLMMAAGPYMKGGTAASAGDEDCVDGFSLAPQRGLCGMTSCHYVADLVRKGMNKVRIINLDNNASNEILLGK